MLNEMKQYKFLKSELDKFINKAILSAAKDGKEICGLLADNGYFIEIIQTKNKIKNGGGFAFYYKEVRQIVAAAEKLGHEIIGTFHSHASFIAKPGENDIACAEDDSLMMIIDVIGKQAALWHIKDMDIKELKFKTIK
jgi:proteasome lid subunit RPN8/RPN11